MAAGVQIRGPEATMIDLEQKNSMDLSAYKTVLQARAMELAQRHTEAEAIERSSHLVSEIQAALRRIENRVFGVCLHCRRPISPRRLDAIPWAAFCITCQQTADELHERVSALGRRYA